MRFSVDAHAIGRHLTGNEVYIRNLLQRFAALDRDSEFIAYIAAPEAVQWIPERFRVRQVSANPFKRLGWDLPLRLREDRPDLLHVQYTAPLGCRTPLVATVHDVSFLERPEFFPLARRLQLRKTVSSTVRRAARILTPSQFSRAAILRYFPSSPDQVVVVPNAVSSEFRPMPYEQARARVLDRFGVAHPYILMVGDLQPRKNQVGLVRAFAELLRMAPAVPHRLVLVGKRNGYTEAVRREAERCGVSGRVHLTGFIADQDLVAVYGGCDMLAFPSFYEGFGIPILEAMACGRAVACSNVSAMPEVADGAAILFDPHSTVEMAKAMRDLLLDRELRQRMERLGQQRAGQFSWELSAAKTLEVYYEVAGSRQRSAAAAARTVTVTKS